MSLIQKGLYVLIGLLSLTSVWMYLVDQSEILSVLAASTTLVVISIIFLAGKQNFTAFEKYLTIGLIVCFIGDIFLLVPQWVDYTMACFLVAHFILAFAFSTFHGFDMSIKPLIFSLLISALTTYFIYPDIEGLEIFVILYGISLIVMHWQGNALYDRKKTKGYLFIKIGITLFFISEILSAIYLFSYPDVSLNVLVHITYWLGITAIVHVTTLDKPEVNAASQHPM